jgi:hypothetical protein
MTKLVILILAQNNYKIKHFVINSNKTDTNFILNSQYTIYERAEIKASELKASDVVIICNPKLLNDKIKEDLAKSNTALIMLQESEIVIHNLNKKFQIFNDKQFISFSGILGSLRSPDIASSDPFIPQVPVFVNFH